MSDSTLPPLKSSRGPIWRTVLLVVVLFLLYAFAVQVTEINLARPLDPNRQANVIRVLRLLADPDFIQVENGSISLSQATIITVERIIETIFMALMASTIGTALAVPISFIAARNLMEPVTSPLAAIMAGLVALPIGGWVGAQLTRYLLMAADLTGGSGWLNAVAAVVLGILIWLLLRNLTPDPDAGGAVQFWLRLGTAVLLAVVTLGVLANLGSSGGEWLEDRLGVFGFWGNFITVLSDLTLVGLPALVGVIGAVVGAANGARLGQEGVLRLSNGTARVVTAVLAAAGAFIFVFGVGSALDWLYLFDNPQNWTTIPGAVAAGLGAVVGLLLPPKHPFRIGFLIYSVSRAILNILRSIEPLIMGIVFVVWVSLGPFAGVMALTLHSIAALGKLFSEQVEGIDDGPIEAITSTGASRLQMIVFGVIPQIVPPFIAFALYRWDINVRMSTIIGFVGGGGIGFVLSQNIQQLRYRQASVMMIAIAIVVSTLDYISSRVRARII